MYSIMKDSNKIQYGVSEYVVDTKDDIEQIPLRDIKPGTICLVIDTSDVYMLNNNKEWKVL